MNKNISISILIISTFFTISFTLPSYSANLDSNIANKKLNAVRFSPDNKLLATAGADKKIVIWDIASNKPLEILSGHKGNITEISFTPDGKKLLSASEDKTVKVWDIKSGKEVLNINASNYGIYALAISPDGKKLATGSLKEIKLWDLDSGKQIAINIVDKYVSSLAFSKKGRLIAVGSYETISFFNTRSLKKYYSIKKAHFGYVSSLAFNPMNRFLVSGSLDSTIKLWDWTINNIDEFSEVLKYHNAPVTSIVFSPDGNLIASSSWDKTVRIFDLNQNKTLFTIKLQSSINDISFSSDGKYLAIGNSSGVVTYKSLTINGFKSKLNDKVL